MNEERTIPIMLKVWAGGDPHDYRYIKRSIPSLLHSDLPRGARIVIIDDQSTDARVVRLLHRWAGQDPRIELWRNPRRLGPNGGQAYNFPEVVAKYPDAELFVLCDDDIIYHPGWLQRLIRVQKEASERGLIGVLSALNVPFRPGRTMVRLPTSEVLIKERQAALNWLLPRNVYEKVGPFRDTGIAYDTDYCDRLAAAGLPVMCLRPSWVQNIGYFGAYQYGDEYTAKDFIGTPDPWLQLWLRARDAWLRLRRGLATAAHRSASPHRGASGTTSIRL